MPDLCDVCRSSLPLLLLSAVAHGDFLNPGEPGAVDGPWIRSDRAEAVHVRAAPDTAELNEVTRVDGHEHTLSVIAGSSTAPGRVAVAEDGTIAINQYQERLVRLFDRDGQPIGSVGRWGQGPGEFEEPGPLTWRGDTLWVFDGRRLRATAYSRSGEYLTSFRYRNQTDPGNVDGEGLPIFRAPFVVPRDLSAGGVPSLFVWAAAALPPSGFEDVQVLLRITAFGVVERLIAVMPDKLDEYEYSSLFPNRWVYDISRRAGRAAHARGAPLDGPDAGTFDVTAVDLEGDTIFSRRLPFELVRVTDAARDSVLDRYRNPETARRRRSEPVPPFFPPLHGLVVGDDASVWLQMRPRAEGQPYIVLDSLGVEVGTAMLPPRSRVAVARLGRIWAVEKDEFDVESVVEYEVVWR